MDLHEKLPQFELLQPDPTPAPRRNPFAAIHERLQSEQTNPDLQAPAEVTVVAEAPSETARRALERAKARAFKEGLVVTDTPEWSTAELRPLYATDRLTVNLGELGFGSQIRQAHALSAAFALVRHIDASGSLPDDPTTVIGVGRQRTELTYDIALRSVQALGNAPGILSDPSLEELAVNKQHDQFLVETVRGLVSNGNQEVLIRTVLGLRQEFMSADAYRSVETELSSTLASFADHDLSIAKIGHMDEAGLFSMYTESGQLIGQFTEQTVLLILAMDIYGQAVGQVTSNEHSMIHSLATSLKNHGILFSNWQNDAIRNGPGLCDPTKEAEQRMIEMQHGVIDTSEIVTDPINGKQSIHVNKVDCPPCAEKADTLLTTHFEPIQPHDLIVEEPHETTPDLLEVPIRLLEDERHPQHFTDDLHILEQLSLRDRLLREQAGSLAIAHTNQEQSPRGSRWKLDLVSWSPVVGSFYGEGTPKPTAHTLPSEHMSTLSAVSQEAGPTIGASTTLHIVHGASRTPDANIVNEQPSIPRSPDTLRPEREAHDSLLTTPSSHPSGASADNGISIPEKTIGQITHDIGKNREVAGTDETAGVSIETKTPARALQDKRAVYLTLVRNRTEQKSRTNSTKATSTREVHNRSAQSKRQSTKRRLRTAATPARTVQAASTRRLTTNSSIRTSTIRTKASIHVLQDTSTKDTAIRTHTKGEAQRAKLQLTITPPGQFPTENPQQVQHLVRGILNSYAKAA